MKRLILSGLALSSLIGCSSETSTLTVDALVSEVASGVKGIQVANVVEKPSNTESLEIQSSFGHARHENGVIYFDAPLTSKPQKTTITVNALRGAEILDSATLLINALEDSHIISLLEGAEKTLGMISTKSNDLEELAMLHFLHDVGIASGSISSEEASDTNAWATSVIEDSLELAKHEIHDALMAYQEGIYSYEPFVSSFKHLDSNPVLEFLPLLIEALDLEYETFSDQSFNHEYLSRFYGDELFGSWREGTFEFSDQFGYMRVTPAYLKRECEGE